MSTQSTFSPIDGRLFVDRPLASDREIDLALTAGKAAARSWRRLPLSERLPLLHAMVDAFVAGVDEIGPELAWQMGRPVRYGAGEVRGFEDRARTMLRLATEALADIVPAERPGFVRYIRREPLGLVLVLAPWNYPYLTVVNVLIPALAAGNAVLLKHSDQTPLCAERLLRAAQTADLPPGLFQILHVEHERVGGMVADPRVDLVAFTGSVEGGRAVHRAAAGTFKVVGLELGGKDPAYVRPDADLPYAIENIVDAACFNSGQSCCAVERVYVHRDVYPAFVEGAAELVGRYRLGNPLDPETTLGPVVRARNARLIRRQVQQAIEAGARALVDPARFPLDDGEGAYVAPQVLVDVDHGMELMREETFGPVMGVMAVASDEEAIARMNDSRYGLTASIWTRDLEAAQRIGDELETGTVFMNRADYLDPELAWVGVKDSGRGCTLSRVGYEALTRPKSFHLRTP